MIENQIDFEELLLGGILRNYTTKAANILSLLNENDISGTSCKWLLNAMKHLSASGSPVDVLTVQIEMDKAIADNRIPVRVDSGWLFEIAKNGVGSGSFDYYASKIKANAAMARALVSLDAIKESILTTNDPSAALTAARAAMAAMDFGVSRAKPRRLDSLAEEYLEHRMAVYEGRANGGINLTRDGMSHAFGTIGMSDFIVIAGRPGSGKTELAVSVACNLALDNGRAVLYKSLEMEGMEVAERALLSEAGVSVDNMASGKCFETSEAGLIGMAVTRIKDKPFFVDDSTGCSIDTICIDVKDFCAEQPNVGAVIVDYVGLMELGRHPRHDLAISEITRKLKLLAKEMKIPVFGLFQLSRDVEKRVGNRRPVAADLRDSGSIEQDADKIVIVHRDCINNPTTPMKNVAELLNVKRRRGQPTNGYMNFVNGHFLPIPDDEQAKWRITAEDKQEEAPRKKRSGLNFDDDV